MVKLYSRATCAPCNTLKIYLKNKNIAYDELDLDENPSLLDEVIKMVGYPIVPVAVVGNEVVPGLNIARLNALLSPQSVV